ncbi:MAG TPA: acyltransferase [Steroidobacteraceae bacterium]|nr:acyltransferase [Steroidobacteraceae bacterium]
MASKASVHIKSLDGIRALAALLVFIAHAGLDRLVPGGFGVTIFFFLSGYLITTLLRIEFAEQQRISLVRFYLRRAYRILPPMYLTLGVIAALCAWQGTLGNITSGAVLAQLLQMTNYYTIGFGEQHLVPYTGVMWSLSVEEHYYLLYPLALLVMLPRLDRRRIGQLLLAACALVLLWRCVLTFLLHVGSDYTYIATDARFDSILFGCVLGMVFNPALDREGEPTPVRAMAALALGAALLLFTLLNRDESFRTTLRYTLQGLALLPVFYCAVRFPHWPLFGWLQWRAMRGLGLISYTFYLIHFKALDIASGLLGSDGIARAGLAFGLAVAFSWMMYLLVERRCAELRRRLHG